MLDIPDAGRELASVGLSSNKKKNESMPVGFAVFGPFNVPLNLVGDLDASAAAMRQFWLDVEGRRLGLSRACGCFVLSVLRNESLPWYVGSCSDEPFARSCFNLASAERCRTALAEAGSGTPHLHFIAKLTPAGKLAKPGIRQRSDIALLERIVLGFSLNRNEKVATDRIGPCPRLSSLAGLLLGPASHSTLDQRALRRVLGF
jgi:hypothetical protein